jgi:hypothetical protein
MAATKKLLKTCDKEDKFYKSSDCPTCPVCEMERKPESGFLANSSRLPVGRSSAKGITTLTKLSKYSEREILQFHGMGPSTIPTLKKPLKESGLTFKKRLLPNIKGYPNARWKITHRADMLSRASSRAGHDGA